jgi:type 1 glutamine amidotransferase
MTLRIAKSLLVIILTVRYGSSAEPAKTRIVLVGTKPDHPYASHMYEFECQLLAKCLVQTPGVEAVTARGWPDNDVLQNARSVVFYSSPAGEIVLAPPARDSFRRLMSNGVGFVAIHWATGVGYSRLADEPGLRDEYLATLGGWFRRPPCDVKIGTSRVVKIDPQHAVCRGWSEFELRDEFYLDLVFHERMHPILKVDVDQRQQVVAWSFERSNSNGGRSFGMTLGHFHSSFANEAFRRAVINAILWTAHIEPPAAGSPVAITEAELTLPAAPEAEK